ncbi:uncharacterized protein LOC6545839 [Drosophila erecta]|uniref:Uncharacterized protein n=1 Tax=Drosophila erecta TaxID=7220 RepID=B3ND44_DROER|nr:uncharacterized protein LOC6545839 [Drosophila erecta]EDV51766.1 uncharacterized protein Dere_GG13717 [Drosophila erecta]
MSSSTSSDKPTTSSAVVKSKGSIEALEEIDNRLQVLLERLSTLEKSMANLSVHPADEDDGDDYQDLKTLEDELDEQEKDIGAVGEIIELDKEATENN